MTPLHIASVAVSVALIIVSVAVIVRSFREEWTRVRETFGAPQVSGAFSAKMEATHCPATEVYPCGGAFEAGR